MMVLLLEQAPHLNHDTSMGHTIGVVVVIALLIFFAWLVFCGSKPKK
jgi:hypothetical protein